MDDDRAEGYDPKNKQMSDLFESERYNTLSSSVPSEESEILQSESDDVPSSSGLTREDLKTVDSPLDPDGSLNTSVVASSGKEIVEVDGRFGLREETGDGDVAVAVSPCGRFLKYSQVIGVGSVKTVFRGLDSETGVAVAWCELLEKCVSKAERKRFREEAELLKQLQHPNIVRFYSSWEFSSNRKKNFVLVTELMTSGTLKTYLKRFKSLNMKVFKDWCVQILRALQYLHSRRPLIIHRDLKCDNIFITGASGLVKIGDLGLSTRKRLSFARSVVGTPEFMAPEMYEEHYDESVDIYAFGMCMLEMLISEYPYNECSTPTQIYKKVIMGVKPDGLGKVEDLKTRDIIEWCIRFEKHDRPTCRQLLISNYFAENKCIRLDPVSPKTFIYDPECNVIQFRLQVTDPGRRSQQHQEDEAIIFSFDIRKDCSETMSLDMCNSNIISTDDARLVENMINSHVAAMEEHKRTIHSQQVRVLSPILMEPQIESISMVSSSPSESPEPSFENPSKVELCPNVTAICMARPTKSVIRVPGLSITNIVNRTLVYCLMENLQLTITFQFDVNTVDVTKCTASLIKHGMLTGSQIASFVSAMDEIIRQVKEDPTQLPSIRFSEDGDMLGHRPVQLKRHLTFAPDTKPPAPIACVEPSQSSSASTSASPRAKPAMKSSRFSVSTVNENQLRNRTSFRPATPPPRPPTWSPLGRRTSVKKPSYMSTQSKRQTECTSHIPLAQRAQHASVSSRQHALGSCRSPVKHARSSISPPKGFISRLPSKPHTPHTPRKFRVPQTQLAVTTTHHNPLEEPLQQLAMKEDFSASPQATELPALSDSCSQPCSPSQQRRIKLITQVQFPKFQPEQQRFSPICTQQMSQFYPPPIDSQVNMLTDPSQGQQHMFATGSHDPPITSTEEFYSEPHFQRFGSPGSIQAFTDANFSVQQQMQSYQQARGISQMNMSVEELLPLSTTNPSILPMMLQSDIKLSLDNTRNLMSGLHVESSVRQSLMLLFQRQHIEEEDLRLKHLFELEEFLRSYRRANSEGGEGGGENNPPRTMNQEPSNFMSHHIEIGDGMPRRLHHPPPPPPGYSTFFHQKPDEALQFRGHPQMQLPFQRPPYYHQPHAPLPLQFRPPLYGLCFNQQPLNMENSSPLHFDYIAQQMHMGRPILGSLSGDHNADPPPTFMGRPILGSLSEGFSPLFRPPPDATEITQQQQRQQFSYEYGPGGPSTNPN